MDDGILVRGRWLVTDAASEVLEDAALLITGGRVERVGGWNDLRADYPDLLQRRGLGGEPIRAQREFWDLHELRESTGYVWPGGAHKAACRRSTGKRHVAGVRRVRWAPRFCRTSIRARERGRDVSAQCVHRDSPAAACRGAPGAQVLLTTSADEGSSTAESAVSVCDTGRQVSSRPGRTNGCSSVSGVMKLCGR